VFTFVFLCVSMDMCVCLFVLFVLLLTTGLKKTVDDDDDEIVANVCMFANGVVRGINTQGKIHGLKITLA